MTPIEFIEAGMKLYGRKHWVRELATALGVNVSTIRRLLQREQIPGPYEVAIKGLLQHKRANDIIMRDAHKVRREQQSAAPAPAVSAAHSSLDNPDE